MYVFFKLIILRPHPHFTRHIRKKSQQNHPHFARFLVNSFFSDYRDVARQSCAMVPKWRFLRPVFAVSRVQHIVDLHSKFALGPHHVWNYGKHPICGR